MPGTYLAKGVSDVGQASRLSYFRPGVSVLSDYAGRAMNDNFMEWLALG
jgi:hypothetical protein